MAPLRTQLPTIQNWSCHSCSGCCRQHQIEVTDEERQRILDQRWDEDEAIGPGRPTTVPLGGLFGKRRYRLAHQEDGACIFLDEKGLCRIHAKFGEEAKPLACRLYPYAFHPAGKKVAVSLRFSCPSVVANRGKPLVKQTKEIQKLARDVVPEQARGLPPPEVTPGQRLDWPDFLRFIDALDGTLAETDVPVAIRLLRALFWVNLVSEARFEAVRGPRLGEFLQLVTEAARHEVPQDGEAVGEPSGPAKTQFRLLVAQYGRRDTALEAQGGWRHRWRLLKAALRFARGTGDVPPLQEAFRSVPFETIEQPCDGLPQGAEELFTRYFRVKVQGLHFCGPGYYGVPLVEGFHSLSLVFPAVLWLSRWLAAGQGRTTLIDDDVARALAIADHHHGFSPAFGQWSFRRRVRMLARTGAIGKLCAWYAR